MMANANWSNRTQPMNYSCTTSTNTRTHTHTHIRRVDQALNYRRETVKMSVSVDSLIAVSQSWRLQDGAQGRHEPCVCLHVGKDDQLVDWSMRMQRTKRTTKSANKQRAVKGQRRRQKQVPETMNLGLKEKERGGEKGELR